MLLTIMNRMRSHAPRIAAVSFMLAALLTLAVGLPALAQSSTFTVTVSGSTNYTVSGQPDPTLALTRGRTYTFSVNAPGHPFYVKTAPVTGTGSTYDAGVTNNGATGGTITFVVPLNAPNTLFYQCSVHGAMSGTLNIINPPPVPSSNARTTILMIGALLLIMMFSLMLVPRRVKRA